VSEEEFAYCPAQADYSESVDGRVEAAQFGRESVTLNRRRHLMYDLHPEGSEAAESLRMSISDVIRVTRKFLSEDAGYGKVTISSVVAIEPDSKWKVLAEIAGVGPERKEVVVDDKDGNVVSYKQA